MNERMLLILRVPARRRAAAATLATAVLCCAALPAAAAWEVAHGDPANRGFADVVTAPAGKGSLSVPGLGTFAPGAGPAIAPDGTVYLGTLEGKVIALHADGKPFWSRDITPGQAIMASPAVGADGSVYVIGVKTAKIRDNRSGETKTRTVFESTLHRFTSSGGWVGQTPFPSHGGVGYTTAAPNIVRTGGVDVVLVPALYANPPFREVRVIAFTADGAVLADQKVVRDAGKVTGGGDWHPAQLVCLVPVLGTLPCILACAPPCEYTPPRTAGPLPPPMPAVAVFTFALGRGDAPRVVANDGGHTIVGYTFSSSGLTETSRVRDEARRLISTPMVLPDGDTLVGTADGAMVFAGLSMIKQLPVTGLGTVVAAPTQTVSGLVAVVGTKAVALLRDAKVLSRAPLPAPSYTSAAASRTHFFVSTTDALLTFDAEAQVPLKTFDWVGGGLWPPAIGPQGHVYAMASNILFVFPPPKRGPGAQTVGQVIGVTPGVATTPQPAATTPAPTGPKRYKDPKGPTGLRLYACTEVGGSECERPVAVAFCQGQGFGTAGEYDVDNKKTKAETLGGEVCTKKRCKVFEYIECLN